MTIDIQTLIEERPHLKDPLEFYARWQHFHSQATELMPRNGSASAALDSVYPRESIGPVLRSFASIFDLSPDYLSPLGQALEKGDIDFMRLPLDEIPENSLPYSEEELTSIFFLLCRPFFLGLREKCPSNERAWEDGRCPLCSARPALASIVEGPRRLLYCSWCGTSGPYRFIGCPNCGCEDQAKLGTLMPEGEAGYRVVTCDTCRTYVKVVESEVLNRMTMDLADLASLPLDIVTQGRNYTRRVPNPVGLKKIV